MTDACIITCAVSGAVANKQHCEAIPYTPEEYAKEVRRARDAGASIVHIHARKPTARRPSSPSDYRPSPRRPGRDAGHHHQLLDRRGRPADGRARRAHHRPAPEIAALNMGSMNYAKYSEKRKEFVFNFVFANSFDDIVFLRSG